MSQFEFISVPVALLYSFVVARLMTGLGPALDHDRRYWVHLLWLAQIIGACITTWWGFWVTQDSHWTASRFLLVLALPGIQLLRVSALLGEAPASVVSFRAHFYENRSRFFAIGFVGNLIGAGILFTDTRPVALAPLSALAISLAFNALGFAFSNARLQASLAVVFVSWIYLLLFLMPTG